MMSPSLHLWSRAAVHRLASTKPQSFFVLMYDVLFLTHDKLSNAIPACCFTSYGKTALGIRRCPCFVLSVSAMWLSHRTLSTTVAPDIRILRFTRFCMACLHVVVLGTRAHEVWLAQDASSTLCVQWTHLCMCCCALVLFKLMLWAVEAKCADSQQAAAFGKSMERGWSWPLHHYQERLTAALRSSQCLKRLRIKRWEALVILSTSHVCDRPKAKLWEKQSYEGLNCKQQLSIAVSRTSSRRAWEDIYDEFWTWESEIKKYRLNQQERLTRREAMDCFGLL